MKDSYKQNTKQYPYDSYPKDTVGVHMVILAQACYTMTTIKHEVLLYDERAPVSQQTAACIAALCNSYL